MKSYLNQREVALFMMVSTMIDTVEESLDKPMTKEERTCLKYLRTFGKKFQEAVFSRIDQKTGKKIVSYAENYAPKFFPKTSADYQKIQITKDDYYDLIEMVLEAKCRGCDGEEGCKYRDVLSRCYVPPYDETRACEYMVKESDLEVKK